jgi:hypothetical protein
MKHDLTFRTLLLVSCAALLAAPVGAKGPTEATRAANRAVLEKLNFDDYKGQQSSKADAKVTLTREALNREGTSKLDDELRSGGIKVAGASPKAFDDFVSALVAFDGWYHVVTPVEAKAPTPAASTR